jgi:hypothetical protein
MLDISFSNALEKLVLISGKGCCCCQGAFRLHGILS